MRSLHSASTLMVVTPACVLTDIPETVRKSASTSTSADAWEPAG